MKTNNASGRTLALAIGAWAIFKCILNAIIGGGFDAGSLIAAVVIIAAALLGIKYTNYAVAAILAIVVIINLFGNIGMLFHLNTMIKGLVFLVEGLVDIICALVLCAAPNVREHFSNDFSDLGQ